MSSRFLKKGNKPSPKPPELEQRSGADSEETGAPKKRRGGRQRKVTVGPRTSADAPPLNGPPETPPFTIGDRRQPQGAQEGMIPVRAILRNLGMHMSTTKEAAAVLGIAESTLFEWFKREPEARQIWDDAREIGKFSLRTKLFKLADKQGPVAMFLAMNHLEYEDKRFLSIKGKIDHTHSPLGKLLAELDTGRFGKTIELEQEGEDAYALPGLPRK